jgi:hypothetical protein
MVIFDGCEKKGRAKVGKSRIILLVVCSYAHCGKAPSLAVYLLLIADCR